MGKAKQVKPLPSANQSALTKFFDLKKSDRSAPPSQHEDADEDIVIVADPQPAPRSAAPGPPVNLHPAPARPVAIAAAAAKSPRALKPVPGKPIPVGRPMPAAAKPIPVAAPSKPRQAAPAAPFAAAAAMPVQQQQPDTGAGLKRPLEPPSAATAPEAPAPKRTRTSQQPPQQPGQPGGSSQPSSRGGTAGAAAPAAPSKAAARSPARTGPPAMAPQPQPEAPQPAAPLRQAETASTSAAAAAAAPAAPAPSKPSTRSAKATPARRQEPEANHSPPNFSQDEFRVVWEEDVRPLPPVPAPGQAPTRKPRSRIFLAKAIKAVAAIRGRAAQNNTENDRAQDEAMENDQLLAQLFGIMAGESAGPAPAPAAAARGGAGARGSAAAAGPSGMMTPATRGGRKPGAAPPSTGRRSSGGGRTPSSAGRRGTEILSILEQWEALGAGGEMGMEEDAPAGPALPTVPEEPKGPLVASGVGLSAADGSAQAAAAVASLPSELRVEHPNPNPNPGGPGPSPSKATMGPASPGEEAFWALAVDHIDIAMTQYQVGPPQQSGGTSGGGSSGPSGQSSGPTGGGGAVSHKAAAAPAPQQDRPWSSSASQPAPGPYQNPGHPQGQGQGQGHYQHHQGFQTSQQQPHYQQQRGAKSAPPPPFAAPGKASGVGKGPYGPIMSQGPPSNAGAGPAGAGHSASSSGRGPLASSQPHQGPVGNRGGPMGMGPPPSQAAARPGQGPPQQQQQQQPLPQRFGGRPGSGSAAAAPQQQPMGPQRGGAGQNHSYQGAPQNANYNQQQQLGQGQGASQQHYQQNQQQGRPAGVAPGACRPAPPPSFGGPRQDEGGGGGGGGWGPSGHNPGAGAGQGGPGPAAAGGSGQQQPQPAAGGGQGRHRLTQDLPPLHLTPSLPGAAPGLTPSADRDRERFVVESVFEIPDNNEKLLSLTSPDGKSRVAVRLLHSWYDTDVRESDIINVIMSDESCALRQAGETPPVPKQLTLDDYCSHLLVLHPDLLLSGTRVSTGMSCARKSILEEILPGQGGKAALQGTMLHGLFEALIQGGGAEGGDKWLSDKIGAIIKENLISMYDVGLQESDARQALERSVGPILQFQSRFMSDLMPEWARAAAPPPPPPDRPAGREDGMPRAPKPVALAGAEEVKILHVEPALAGAAMVVREVMDVEETVWAPRFGLKGQIDASLRADVEGLPGPFIDVGQSLGEAPLVRMLPPGRAVSAVVPLEFKTGRPWLSHGAQVSLYLLLLSEKYQEATQFGLLWYLNDATPTLVKGKASEFRGLMQLRNSLASGLVAKQRSGALPPLKEHGRECERCFQRTACSLYHRAVEGGEIGSFPRPEVSTEFTGHLSDKHLDYFRHWERLIGLEEGPIWKRKSEVWRVGGAEREALGRCIAGLEMVGPAPGPATSSAGSHRYLFRRARPCSSPPPGSHVSQPEPPVMAGAAGIQPGDAVVLGLEGRQACVAYGFLHSSGADGYVVGTHKPLEGSARLAADNGVTWRVDRDEVSSTFPRYRENMVRLMTDKTDAAAKLRRLVIDMEPPKFDSSRLLQPGPSDQASLAYLDSIRGSVNADQLKALERTLEAEDYLLILGYPGTGKTQTIVHAIKALVARGDRVLVTSYTNTAVDNLLLRLRGRDGAAAESGAALSDTDIVRIGRRDGCHPDLAELTVGDSGAMSDHGQPGSVAAINERLQSAKVVGCTCLSSNHALLRHLTFDACIVDEAAQITVPALLGPLLKARRFVLVGDHHQLPPLVTNRDAQKEGLDIPLLRTLGHHHGGAEVALTAQYRMAQDILDLPNALVYSGQLRCASESVATACLTLPGFAREAPRLPGWLRAALDPQQRVVFLDTDTVGLSDREGQGPTTTVGQVRHSPYAEYRSGEVVRNPAEASLCAGLAAWMARLGLAPRDLCIVSPYRAQVSLLQQTVSNHRSFAAGPRHTPSRHPPETLTIDKCQGRDRSCVIVSLVRSNPEGESGPLLADSRRINVAITRARHKLILVGSGRTLMSSPLFSRVLGMCRERGWAVGVGDGPDAALVKGPVSQSQQAPQ